MAKTPEGQSAHDGPMRRREGIAQLPREQLKAIETLVRSEYTLGELRAFIHPASLGFLIPPRKLSAEMIAAGVAVAEIPGDIIMQYITAYRAGWNDMPDHEVLLTTLKTLYREGARARSEHDLNERTP